MKKYAIAFAVSLFLGTFQGSPVRAGENDWPGWRGVARDDISRETGLLKSWPEDGPKRLWMYEDAGWGYSGPAIVDGRLITMGTIGEDENVKETLIALDANTGELLWRTEIGKVLENRWGDGPRGTPTVDGDYIYAMGGQGELICASLSDGKIKWRSSMTKDFSGKTPNWGYTESVLVDGDRVICSPGGDGASVVSLDKETGEAIWKTDGMETQVHYSSIIKINHGGKDQYVKLTVSELVGIDADNGKVLWSTDWPGRTAVIPTPIFKDGRIYITSGYGVGCKLIELDSNNNVSIVYENKEMKNHHGGVLLLGDHLYGYSDGGGWVCQDLDSGEVVWREKSKLKKGAIAYADGRLYCLDETNGTVVLIDASTEGWNEQGRFKLDPQSSIRSRAGKVWTHPVISNGKLYLRDQEYIYCYDVKD